jgi:hypothetical protein
LKLAALQSKLIEVVSMSVELQRSTATGYEQENSLTAILWEALEKGKPGMVDAIGNMRAKLDETSICDRELET